MPMSKALHDALSSDALKEIKIEDKTVLAYVTELYDTAQAKEKVQNSNDDISKERDKLKEKLKTIKTESETKDKAITDKDTEIERLKADSLTPEEKKAWLETKKSGMTDDAKAEFNKLNDNFTKLNEKFEASEKKATETEKNYQEAKRAEKMAGLKDTLKTSLAGYKIGGKNANVAMAYLESENMFKIHEENGQISYKFYTKNDKGEDLSATADDLAKHVATNFENLVDSSGKAGPGNTHDNNKNYPGSKEGQTHPELVDEARDMLTMSNK